MRQKTKVVGEGERMVYQVIGDDWKGHVERE